MLYEEEDTCMSPQTKPALAGPEYLDEDAWVQLRDLAWEIDVVSADGVKECVEADT